MDFVTLTIELLKILANVLHSWGFAIIALTIIIRVIMWPSSVSQQRSMRQMQTLQPKMKAIQERYKSNPEMMQRKMMEFYKEHQVNPMSGCLPMLIQLPIFILLYTALMSPQFTEIAGKTDFLFIKRLDATIKSNAGVSFDGKISATPKTKFMTGKTAIVTFIGDEEKEVKIDKPQQAIQVQGEIVVGEPIDFKIPLDNLNLKFSELDKIKSAKVDITNINTREVEKIDFKRDGSNLIASAPSLVVQEEIHYDVIFLVALFVITMWLSQKVMMAQSKNVQMDPQQAAMQKSMGTFMPIMLGFMFVITPIPAGVLLYLVTSNLFQIAQTVYINKKLEAEENTPKTGTKDSTGATIIEAKEVKDVE